MMFRCIVLTCSINSIMTSIMIILKFMRHITQNNCKCKTCLICYLIWEKRYISSNYSIYDSTIILNYNLKLWGNREKKSKISAADIY